jgi:hypothetical protein
MGRGDPAFSVSLYRFGLGNVGRVDWDVFRSHLLDVDGVTSI